MSERIKLHDFIEIEYIGKLTDGTVFDTTSEKVAKEHHLHTPNRKYNPAVICVGERQILPGLDTQLIDKELQKEYSITLPPEKAFGKRDIKQVKIIPADTFKQHNIQPQPGLQVDVDGEIGIISRVSGGRAMVWGKRSCCDEGRLFSKFASAFS